ncbi:ABC-type transport system involved in cytochrome c biogenesis, permease component [Methylacidimicrobium sp. AP8]|uniref:cytochrome c biogenesis protein n=1 Tax=Methylacidimicrobium sp. AP8 TaxID=2730359 RepID=UPI0018BF92C8|nr:cytochrome c biogenesis protein CcsA [Methylacidimicrobium sp. AP8]CAB4244651.1 ABC-type transport system involved in cytochrome c biogenesis, permease component [Methylacidimicrobium sp. AP8]
MQDHGRRKPLTSFATESVLFLSGRPSIVLPDRGGKMGSLAVLLALWLSPDGWEKEPILLISEPSLREALGLPSSRTRFSYEELRNNPALREMALRLGARGTGDPTEDPAKAQRDRAVRGLTERIDLFSRLVTGRALRIVPPPPGTEGRWLTLSEAKAAYPPEAASKLDGAWEAMRTAFLAGKNEEAGAAAVRLAEEIRSLNPGAYPDAAKLLFEQRYHELQPWRWAWICYGAAAICLALTSGWGRRIGYGIGWGLALTGFLFQAYGFYCRIVLAGRPPVTNMYESVIWVAFGVVLFALVLEAVYRSRYILLAALPIAVLCLLFVQTQPLIFDPSLQPLVPVLRNNFWLTVHVLTVTLSYAAFGLALGLGDLYLWRWLRRGPDGRSVDPLLRQYIYRSLQIGVFFLASGVVLGAVWANYSWGRFWDWDPKETWALVALLCYLALLHGSIAGWWGEFGLALGAVLCFLSVLMAWYGVNFVLGKGLHSYGFGSGAVGPVAAFALAELLFAAWCGWVRRKRRAREGMPIAPSPASRAGR